MSTEFDDNSPSPAGATGWASPTARTGELAFSYASSTSSSSDITSNNDVSDIIAPAESPASSAYLTPVDEGDVLSPRPPHRVRDHSIQYIDSASDLSFSSESDTSPISTPTPTPEPQNMPPLEQDPNFLPHGEPQPILILFANPENIAVRRNAAYDFDIPPENDNDN
jgi:hypothetical protein